jgi:hypothetical protein
MHMLAETDAWLDEFVKNAKPAVATMDASPANKTGSQPSLAAKK